MGESSSHLVYGVTFADLTIDESDAGDSKSGEFGMSAVYHGDSHEVVIVFAIRKTAWDNRVNSVAPPKPITSLEIGEDWDSTIAAFCADFGKTPNAGPGWFLTVQEDH